MAQFDVYPNPARGMGDAVPFVLDVQSDHLAALPTRVIVPLGRPDDFQPLRRLNPLVEVDDERFAVMAQHMAAVPAEVLRNPVANLAARRYDILAALDCVFTGI